MRRQALNRTPCSGSPALDRIRRLDAGESPPGSRVVAWPPWATRPEISVSTR